MTALYPGHADQHFGSSTWSQHGEDLMLMNLLKLLGLLDSRNWAAPINRMWLDIGAHHPVNISNTALLYSKGFRGVNVEANPNLIELFRAMRPEDENVCVGVGAVEGVQPFYMYDEKSGRNTFDQAEVLSFSRQSGMQVKETLTLQLRTIAQIVADHCEGKYPPLLSIDIEGLDYEVLRSCDFTKSRPSVICVEARQNKAVPFTALSTPIAIMLAELWGFFVYCRMGENLIFVHEDNRRLVY